MPPSFSGSGSAPSGPGRIGRSASFVPPSEFDEYRLVRPIGRGATGLVYLAHDTLLDRLVAVKFVIAFHSDAVARFLVEARAAARLSHPNVVTVFRVGELDGRPYLVSEFIRGRSLDKLARPLPWRRALELGIGLARGLAAAHRHGVLHRDIKPGNAILADAGEVKLLDFGLAKLLEPGPRPRAALATVTALPRATAHETPIAQDEAAPPCEAPDDPSPSPDPPDSATGAAGTRFHGSRLESPPSDLTGDGALVGTPCYMSPEMWRGEAATRRSDLYALGALLYELLCGRPPFRDVPAPDLPQAVQEREARALIEVAPTVDRRLAAIVERCLRLDPEARFASGDELREALEQLTQTGPALSLPQGNPYRGLQSFGAEHRALFFGRGAEIRAVLDRLRAEPFVLVAGDSGVGKSSLCGAGVLPLLVDGALGDGRSFQVARLVPGRHPLAALADALLPVVGMGGDEEALGELLESDPQAVARRLRKHLGETGGLLLLLDQLEEAVTLAAPEEAARFGEALAPLLPGVPGVKLLATARGDFLTRLAGLPGLGDELSRALYLLRPLSRENAREAICGPARAKDVRFESEALVEELCDSAARADGSLPLLQFTLAELWDARDQNTGVISAAALEAIGGVAGALARHADGVLARLTAPRRAAARTVLLSLVTLAGTRARRTEPELGAADPATREALEALVRGRLVVAREGAEGPTYELAHEALLRGWSTLGSWLGEEADLRAARARLDAAALEWERLGGAREALWGARQLGEMAVLLGGGPLPARQAAFLATSRRALGRQRLLRRASLVALPLVAALVWAGIRLHARRDLGLQVDRQVADARMQLDRAHARAAEMRRLRREAFARYDAQAREAGEQSWLGALAAAAEAQRAYDAALPSLESALALDRGRNDVRQLFAELLYERAAMAELAHEPIDGDLVARRLRLYDDAGEYLRRWNAPGRLTLETSPPGARVSLERFVLDERRRRRATPVGDLGLTPFREARLEPGSYLLFLALPDRPPISLPLVIERGQAQSLRVALPAATQVPEGFVYVPAGRFYFGTAADEGQREFFGTVPLHEVETGPYLIARTETTIGDWLDFLRALPPAERKQRTPRVSAALGSHGALALEDRPDGLWRLTFQPTTKAYQARAGERIHYGGRLRRATQDWLRFPVSGISAEDAQAYVAWLARSGRVAGARLCTEYEWERAARGADEREFPHGERLEPDDANFDQTYGKQPLAMGPDEVGSHPASRSPFGLDDMVGNVWEWTRSSLAAGELVARGGCYYFGAPALHVPNREPAERTMRDLTVGMRVCASVPTSLEVGAKGP